MNPDPGHNRVLVERLQDRLQLIAGNSPGRWSHKVIRSSQVRHESRFMSRGCKVIESWQLMLHDVAELCAAARRAVPA